MYTNDTDITKHLSMANGDNFQILKGPRLSNPKNVLSYLNLHWIRNKFENLQEIIKQNIDVLPLRKLEGYHSPYRLDMSRKSGGLLVYVKKIIPSRQLSLPKFQFKIQALPFELNLRNEKWLVILIHRPSLDSLTRFLEFLMV